MNYRNLSSKSENKGYIVCLLIPLLCVLRYYESPIGLLANRLSISVMIVMVGLIPFLTKRKFADENATTVNCYVLFCVVILGCYLLSLLLYDFVWDGAALVFNKQLYILLVAILCLYCFLGYVNHSLLIKLYINLSVLFAVLGIMQWVLGLMGKGVDIKIPLLHYYNGGEKFTLFSQMDTFNHVPSAFAEASHFAAFLLPAIVFILAKYNTKYRFAKLAVLVAGVLVSTSANGIICLVIIIVSLACFSQEKMKLSRLVIGALLIVATIWVLFSGSLNEILEGVFSSDEGGDTKADYRIYRGFELFGKLPFHQKLFGIGNANIQSFYSAGLMHSEFDRPWRAIDFLSAFSAIIIYNGFAGLLAFALFVGALWKKTSWATRTLILVFAAYSISEDLYFNEYWLLYISLICASRCVFESRASYRKKIV